MTLAFDHVAAQAAGIITARPDFDAVTRGRIVVFVRRPQDHAALRKQAESAPQYGGRLQVLRDQALDLRVALRLDHPAVLIINRRRALDQLLQNALDAEQDVEITLPGGFNVSPRLAQAMKLLPGVERVEDL